MTHKTAAIFFLLSVGLLFADYNPPVRIDQAMERFLTRMQARYRLSPRNPGMQPFFAGDLNRLIDSLRATGRLSLREEYKLSALQKRLDPRGGRLCRHTGDDAVQVRLYISLLGDVETAFRAGNSPASLGGKGIINPRLTGNIGNLSFFSEVDVWTEYRSDTLFSKSRYQPYDGVPYNLYGRNTRESHLRSSDLPRGGIHYERGRVGLGISIDYLKLGPAKFYPLTLSGFAPPITFFHAALDMGMLNYTHFSGLLQSQKNKRKYIYGHRLSGSWKAIEFGVNEIIINGSTTDQQGPEDPRNSLRREYYGEQRQLEIAYLVPFVPFVIVEHYLGDRDNAAVSFDCSVAWPRNFMFYGELHIDDISTPWGIFSDDWGNKLGVTAGMTYYGRILSRDLTCGLEYSRVEPWVYTHFYGGSHRFDHFDTPLGSPLGPNSRAVTAFADLALSPRNALGIRLSSTEKNPATRGGSIEHVFQDDIPGKTPDSTTKTFLGAGPVHHLRPGLYWHFDPFGLFSIDASCEFDLLAERGTSHLALYGALRF